jgi:uracil-DNA glycosylase family 4
LAIPWTALPVARDGVGGRSRAGASGSAGGGFFAVSANSWSVKVAEDEIYERYQAKAISEINALGHEVAQWAAERHPSHAPVIGTGHPLADIFMLKHRPMPAEVQEGVAFFGRAGQAILKSLQRLRIDPMMLYGTACHKVDAELDEEDLERSRAWLVQEIHITQPRVLVVMGEEALAFLNSLEFPLAARAEPDLGEVRRWTPTIETLVVPDIDRSLNEAAAKQSFWTAFKALGAWYENLPPY